MDFLLNKLRNLHITGASVNTPRGDTKKGDIIVGSDLQNNIAINDKSVIKHDRLGQIDQSSDSKPIVMDHQIVNDANKMGPTVLLDEINSSANKLVSLNDILVGPKDVRVDNEYGDNIYKNVEHNNVVSRSAIFDRGDQILPQINMLPIKQPPIAQNINDGLQMKSERQKNLDLTTVQKQIKDNKIPASGSHVSQTIPIEIQDKTVLVLPNMAPNLTETVGLDILDKSVDIAMAKVVTETETSVSQVKFKQLNAEAKPYVPNKVQNSAKVLNCNLNSVSPIPIVQPHNLCDNPITQPVDKKVIESAEQPVEQIVNKLLPEVQILNQPTEIETAIPLIQNKQPTVISLPPVALTNMSDVLDSTQNNTSPILTVRNLMDNPTAQVYDSNSVQQINKEIVVGAVPPIAQLANDLSPTMQILNQGTAIQKLSEILHSQHNAETKPLDANEMPMTANLNENKVVIEARPPVAIIPETKHFVENVLPPVASLPSLAIETTSEVINSSLNHISPNQIDQSQILVQPLSLVSTNQNDEFIQKDQIQQGQSPNEKESVTESIKNMPEYEVAKILDDLFNSTTSTSIPDTTNISFNEVPIPQIKSEKTATSLEASVGMSNKIESVKKNLLTMFDTFDTIQSKLTSETAATPKSGANKLEVILPKRLPDAISAVINATPQSILNSNIQQSASQTVQLENKTKPELPILEFKKLNSEIKSNNDKINSTLESVIANQILDQEYASNVMPATLAEQSNHTKNGNALENMILNQIMEQNSFRSSAEELPESKNVGKSNTTDFQIADIDVTSADNFIEFVDEIIDFALRKVDFLKINATEAVPPLTPVPEEAEEASEAVKLNEFYDYCAFTPTVEPDSINFPTLESFEIDELQAKVMEQADALYLSETPIDEHLPPFSSSVPESPKINELQAKAMEQAHELNLNGTIVDFVNMHPAENMLKISEPNVDTQRKPTAPIAISAVVDKFRTQPKDALLLNSQTSNSSDQMVTSQNEPFFIGDSPSMHQSQSNRPQSPMDTSQTKLSQSMNEVYFDRRLDITGKRSFRRERDQKMMQKSKKDFFNENLNREKSREKSQEPQKMLNRDTPRDSLEDLSNEDSEATKINETDQILRQDGHIEKQENEKPENTSHCKTERKESLKDSLENLVDAVEQDGSIESNLIRQNEVEESIRDSLENLVEAVEAISENVKQHENIDELESRRDLSVEENSITDKKCNCNANKTNDITTVIDKIHEKGVQSDVKQPSAEENVIHNTTTTTPNSLVQSDKNVPSANKTNDLSNRKEHKDGTMSLDIMNGGDKLDSNKYYESVSDEPKIKTDFIMAEYRKPNANSNGDLDKIMNEYDSKEEALIRRLTDKEKTITKMTGVMEAYEKTIAEMIAEKEQLVQEYEKKCINLKSDADLNAQHLASLEDTFADLHAKYERSKQITIGLKDNEEELRNGNLKNLELLNAQEIRYEKMKSHAIGQLQIANEKLEHLQRAHAQETTKLKALLKREELARSSLTEQLQQKVRENDELVKICEELIGKE